MESNAIDHDFGKLLNIAPHLETSVSIYSKPIPLEFKDRWDKWYTPIEAIIDKYELDGHQHEVKVFYDYLKPLFISLARKYKYGEINKLIGKDKKNGYKHSRLSRNVNSEYVDLKKILEHFGSDLLGLYPDDLVLESFTLSNKNNQRITINSETLLRQIEYHILGFLQKHMDSLDSFDRIKQVNKQDASLFQNFIKNEVIYLYNYLSTYKIDRTKKGNSEICKAIVDKIVSWYGNRTNQDTSFTQHDNTYYSNRFKESNFRVN